MPGISTRDLTDRSWQDVLRWLPSDLDTLALATGSIQKRREIRTGAQLLRLACGYAVLDLSLRSTAAWARTQGIADLSDVAVYKRLSAAPPFLNELLLRLLQRRVALPRMGALPWRIRIVDSTTVSAPGSTGADWRIHASYNPEVGEFDALEVTDAKGAEHLERGEPKEGELVLADRGYAHASRILAVRESGAHVLVRVGHSAVPMWAASGERFDPVRWARRKRPHAGRPPAVEEADVVLRGDDGGACTARLLVVRKSREATEQERQRISRERSKKGRTPTARTLAAAAYTFLLCTVPASEAPATLLAELYRVRWQVELAFKRWKSLLDLGELRAREPGLAKCYILAKLVAAVLADSISRAPRAFSPWGYPIEGHAEPLAMVPVGG